jgi:hypothetical protein
MGRFVARDSEELGFRPFGGLGGGRRGDGDIKSKIKEKKAKFKVFFGLWGSGLGI